MSPRSRTLERSTLIMTGIVAVLVMYVFLTLSSDRGSGGDSRNPTISLEFLPGFDRDRVERILIREPDIAARRNGEEGASRSVELERIAHVTTSEDGKEEAGYLWTVTSESGYPARQEKVAELLDLLASMKGGNVQSRNPESHGTLQVDASGKEIRIQDEDGKLVGHFYVGKAIQGFTHTFVRREGSDESVLIPGNLAPKLVTSRNNWLDNQILAFDANQVAQVRIESRAHGTIVLARSPEGEWRAVEPTEFAAEKRLVESMVRPLAALRFLDIAGKGEGRTPEHGLDPPRLVITIETADGKTVTLEGGTDKDERAAYATVTGKDFVFEVSKFTLDKIDRSVEEYRPKEKPAETEDQGDGGGC